MYSSRKLRVLVFSDCMSYGCWIPKAKEAFYPAVLEKLLEQEGVGAVVENASGSGETTGDSLSRLEKDVLTREFDLLVYQCGINDALPRGLTRDQRGRIIRGMYRLGMNEKMRSLARTYFLNPLELVALKLRGPRYYSSVDQTSQNLVHTINRIRNYFNQKMPNFVVSVNPVLNYRFGDAIHHVLACNQALQEVCGSMEDVWYVDTCSAFMREDLPSLLDADKFHLSEKGHLIMAENICGRMMEYLQK